MKGITIHGHNINNLRYADDTALVATNQNKIIWLTKKTKTSMIVLCHHISRPNLNIRN